MNGTECLNRPVSGTWTEKFLCCTQRCLGTHIRRKLSECIDQVKWSWNGHWNSTSHTRSIISGLARIFHHIIFVSNDISFVHILYFSSLGNMFLCFDIMFHTCSILDAMNPNNLILLFTDRDAWLYHTVEMCLFQSYDVEIVRNLPRRAELSRDFLENEEVGCILEVLREWRSSWNSQKQILKKSSRQGEELQNTNPIDTVLSSQPGTGREWKEVHLYRLKIDGKFNVEKLIDFTNQHLFKRPFSEKLF